MIPDRFNQKFKTIYEMEIAGYGHSVTQTINKADARFDTEMSGIRNTVYGAYVWILQNLEFNPFSILPKQPWSNSGWRTMTNRPTRAGGATLTKFGSTAESGALGEAIRPNYQQLEIIPKINHMPASFSTVQQWLAENSADDTIGSMQDTREAFGVFHKEDLSQMLCVDVEAIAHDATGDYAGGLDWEPFDRIVSSHAEEEQIGGDHNGQYDPWNMIDRDTSANHYDTTVMTASESGEIGGADGQLTEDLLQLFEANMMERGNSMANVFLTSYQVIKEFKSIFTGRSRTDGAAASLSEQYAAVGVGGVSTSDGLNVGMMVKSYNGIPIIGSKDMPHGAGEIGRLFALDTSEEKTGMPNIGLQIAIPTQFVGVGQGTPSWPITTGGFVEDEVFWTMGESQCKQFKTQGKIRDMTL